MKFKYVSTFLISLSLTALLWAQNDESQVYKQYSTGKFFEIYKPYQSGTFSVGIQSKGRIANVITDFGQLGQFHVFTPSLNWPAFGDGQDDEQHYGWGVDFMMGYQGDVIESFRDPASNLITRDWQRADENLFSGNVTVSETDLTPIMATSDNQATWPVDDEGNSFWPGWWRVNSEGVPQIGEFTSERDLYTVFTDDANDTPYGIRVEQTAYSFTRNYAQDFLVFRFNIQNTSANTLEDLYPGMMLQFLIDFDNHDLINFIDSDGDGKKDFIYMWDQDQTPKDPWSKVGYIGLLVVNSPNEAGITNFHFFHDDFIPSKDEDFWTILTSDTSNLPDTLKARYFHGDDIHIDDVSYAPALDPEDQNRGGEVTWSFSTGPITLASGDSIPLEIAIVLGDDEESLLENVKWVWDLSEANWNGPNPPASPVVQGFPKDGKAIITWDVSSEKSRDNVSGENDFEGYKIYRSTNNGRSWGDEITDAHGKFAGYVPLAQFDLDNDVSGYDAISGVYLGDNSGLKHTFVDTTVENGIEYWYSVTAYDRGEEDKIESLESSFGLTTDETNIVAVVPLAATANETPAKIAEGEELEPVTGITDGSVSIEIIDPASVKDRNYKITFNSGTPTTFNLLDAESDSILLAAQSLSDASGDNVPLVDGFRLKLVNSSAGIRSIGWTKVSADTCTFAWYTESRTGTDQEVEEEITGYQDYKIVVTDENNGSSVVLTDGVFSHTFHSYITIPIKVYDITDPANPLDISAFTEVFDLRVQFPSSEFLGPLGWDLIPGGAGYNPVLTHTPNTQWPDILALNADTTLGYHVWMKTQNGPASAVAPSVGDEFTIILFKPFSEAVTYEFSTQAKQYTDSKKEDLQDIKVVPNPYFVTSELEDRIMFTHLPNICTIDIYNVAGDRVRSLKHKDNTSTAYWDLKNDKGLEVAYGLYVYVVKTSKGASKTGKFSIIR